jgi:hypothetical protein
MTILWQTKHSFDTASQYNTLYDSQCESNCTYGIFRRTPFTLVTAIKHYQLHDLCLLSQASSEQPTVCLTGAIKIGIIEASIVI